MTTTTTERTPDPDVKRALKLRDQGLSVSAIAARLDRPRATVARWLDPDSTAKDRERKQRYGGTCGSCGGRTSGTRSGYSRVPKLCGDCSRRQRHNAKRWTREAIIEAIQEWERQHGRPPVATEWQRKDGDDSHPVLGSVYGAHGEFATWNDAIVAAGFEPRPTGVQTPEGRARISASIRRRIAEGKGPQTKLWTRQVIIDRIRQYAASNGRAPTLHGSGIPSTSVYREFRTWAEALDQAGVQPRRKENE